MRYVYVKKWSQVAGESHGPFEDLSVPYAETEANHMNVHPR
jgi:hypothetical protein